MPKQTTERIIDRPYSTKSGSGGGTAVSGSAASIPTHSLSGGYHSGTLSDSQAPQFALLDGTRAFTGNITFAGAQTVDGVDISAHAASPSAHHAPVTSGNGISLSGQQVSLAASVAGNGLTHTTGVLDVGQGNGIAVTADAVSVAYNTLKGLALNGSNQIEVNIDTSKGLAFIAGQLTVNVGNGLNLSSGAVVLGTPSSVSVSTSNSVGSATHAHAVVSSSSPGAAASLLASDASGYLTLVRLAATERVTTPLVINSGAMTIQTTSGDLTLTPSGSVSVPTGKAVQSNYTSGWGGSGWRVDHNISFSGESFLEVDNLSVRGTMNVYELVINQIRATNGTLIVSSAGKLDSVSGSNWTFEDPEGSNLCAFAANDLVIIQDVDVNLSTIVRRIVRQVSAVSGKSITVATATGGPTDVGTPRAGDTVVRIGNVSNAARQGVVLLTSDFSNSPYIDVISGVTSWADWTGGTKTKGRFGHLSGLSIGSANEYGLAAGNGFATTDAYLKVSTAGATLNNVGADWRSSGTTFLSISAANGIDIVMPSSAFTRQRGYTFLTTGGVEIGGMYAYTATSPNRNEIFIVADQDGTSNYGTLSTAVNSSAYSAFATISATGPSKTAYLRATYSSSATAIEGSAEQFYIDTPLVTFQNTNAFVITPSGSNNPYIQLENSTIQAVTSGSFEYLGLKGYSASGRVRLGNDTAYSTYVDNVGIGIGIDRTTAAGISKLSTLENGAALSLVNSGFGYASAIMFQSTLQYMTSAMHQAGMATFLGNQYTSSNTRPGMFFYDANGNYFAMFIGEAALTQGDAINSWVSKLRIDNDGTMVIGSSSTFGLKGGIILKASTQSPTSNPTGHGAIWITPAGALMYKSPSGTNTQVAPA